MPHDGHTTRASLLIRLREGGSPADWRRFYELYATLIYQYARDRRCNHAMAQDVVQETMIGLGVALGRFHYDPSRGRFRSWLLRIVHNHIIDAYRRERKYVALDPDDHREPVDSGPTPLTELAAAWDSSWQQNLLALALEELQASLQPSTWDSFRLSVLEDRPVPEVCAALDLDRNTLYQHRHRALSKLKSLIADLQAELGDTP